MNFFSRDWLNNPNFSLQYIIAPILVVLMYEIFITYFLKSQWI